MLTPLSWLRDFTPLDGSPGEIADVLSDLGLVVEGVDHIGEGLDGVITGHVLDVHPHPNATYVRLADVDLGEGQTAQIACGATNLEAGQIVPVATIGTTLPNGMTIEARKLRGEWSNGMICSSDELGLTKNHPDGIMVLPQGIPVGVPFAGIMGIEPDVVYDIEVETNRPDAMCIAGIARDLAGRLRLPFAIPDPVIEESNGRVKDSATISVQRPDLCTRFTARVITDVQVGPSLQLVARRLTLAGMRSINNIVDASNYVMLEYGQPTHPYDLDKLPGHGLIVRAARPGETLVTLDGVKRTLTDSDCVICDAEDAIVGIAGIMGGAGSEISPDTTRVLVEAAVFDAYAINHTSRRLALRTDASARFERRVDPENLERAQGRFCELVQASTPSGPSIAGPSVASGTLDESVSKPNPAPVRVRTARVNAILGTELFDGPIMDYLEPIGFACEATAEGQIDVTIPSFRPDSEREIDIIEEIARMHGYGNIERRVSTSPTVGKLSVHQLGRRRMRALLVGRGLSEAWTAALLGTGDLQRTGLPADAISLTNPMVQEESLLRPSLLPGMLRAVAFNANRRNTGVRLFEIGHVFNFPPKDQPKDKGPLPDERERLGVILASDGDDAIAAAQLWAVFAAALGVSGVGIMNHPVPGLHAGRSAELRTSAGDTIGVLGEVDPAALSRFEIERRVGWIEVDTKMLIDCIEAVPQMRPVSRFPAAEFDLAFIVDSEISASAVDASLRNAAGELVEFIELFDVYRGPQVADGKRSLAYRLRIAALDRTLGEQEVTEARRRCIEAVELEHRASLRS